MGYMRYLNEKKILEYRETGYLVIGPIVKQKEITHIEEEILRLLPYAEKKRTEEGKDATANRFMVGLHLQSEGIQKYAISHQLRRIAAALLGREVEMYFTSTITKAPELNMPLDWHQDFAYDSDKRIDRLIFWTSITDSFPENGGLSVIPSSHKLGSVPHEKSSIYPKDLRATAFDPEAAVPVILKRGEILIIHPLLIHGSGSNVTKLNRVALMVGYQIKKRPVKKRIS